jgi:hypothetical protein
MSERLTAEQIAKHASDMFLGSRATYADCRNYIAAAIRSALAQRDAEWREAVNATPFRRQRLFVEGDPYCRCTCCAPLRALMKEGQDG